MNEEKQMRIIICDDETETAKQVEEEVRAMIENRENYMVSSIHPDALLLEIEEELFDYDIAILDIEYHEKLNGIDLGHMINAKYPLCQIIYLTSILEFASAVYETEHVYFVQKKNRKLTLERALNKAIANYEENKGKDFLEIVSEGKEEIVFQHDIRYIERMDRVLCVHTEEESLKTYTSIRKLMPKLSSAFVRCHGSFVVNLSHVKSVNRERVLMDDGQQLEIGKSFRDRFLKNYMDYLAKRM